MFFSYFRKSNQTIDINITSDTSESSDTITSDYTVNITITPIDETQTNSNEVVQLDQRTWRQKISDVIQDLKPILMFSLELLSKGLEIYVKYQIKKILDNENSTIKYTNYTPSAPLSEDEDYIEYQESIPSAPLYEDEDYVEYQESLPSAPFEQRFTKKKIPIAVPVVEIHTNVPEAIVYQHDDLGPLEAITESDMIGECYQPA